MDLQNDRIRVSMADIMPIIRDKLKEGGCVRLPASGNSMAPLFRHMRDEVILEAVGERQLKKYDMVLYRRENGQYVLHRIVGTDGGKLLLCGDAQYAVEKGIDRHHVIGVVSGFKRNGREHTCSEKKYKIYVFVCVNSRPVRRICRGICRRIKLLLGL